MSSFTPCLLPLTPYAAADASHATPRAPPRHTPATPCRHWYAIISMLLMFYATASPCRCLMFATRRCFCGCCRFSFVAFRLRYAATLMSLAYADIFRRYVIYDAMNNRLAYHALLLLFSMMFFSATPPLDYYATMPPAIRYAATDLPPCHAGARYACQLFFSAATLPPSLTLTLLLRCCFHR